MNGVLWMFSSVLAVVFLVTGLQKVFGYKAARNRLSWVKVLPRPMVALLGVIEILAGLGLVLPALTGTYAWLTPYAAIGAALLMLSAGMFHLLRHEYDDLSVNILLFLMAAFIGYGRLILVPFS